MSSPSGHLHRERREEEEGGKEGGGGKEGKRGRGEGIREGVERKLPQPESRVR